MYDLLTSDDTILSGPLLSARHPGNLNVSFASVESEALMLALKDVVAVSSGSACPSTSVEPSYALRAMGVDEDIAHAWEAGERALEPREARRAPDWSACPA